MSNSDEGGVFVSQLFIDDRLKLKTLERGGNAFIVCTLDSVILAIHVYLTHCSTRHSRARTKIDRTLYSNVSLQVHFQGEITCQATEGETKWHPRLI